MVPRATERVSTSFPDRGLFLSLQGIRRQLEAMPHDLYLVRLIHQATRRAFPGERLWTAAQLIKEATVRFLRVRTVGGTPATVSFDGAAPTYVDGLLQLNIQLAANTPSGTALPVIITVGNSSSPATAALAVQSH
jgi:hypothetical protein